MKYEAFSAISLEPYNNLVQKIAEDLHSGKLQPSDLDEKLIKQMFSDLSEGTKTVYGDKWMKLDVKEPNSLIQKFKKNLWQFSSAKTLAELEKMNSLLLDKGKIRPFQEFLKDAQKVNENFNRNYLQAEYQTAVKGAQHAEKWQQFLKNSDLFPNLEYRTVSDNRVRPEHAALSGTVKPIHDAFWNTYYPPNGWRCRCYVVATAGTATPGKVEDQTVKPEFRGNVAKDAEIFTQKGGFFKLLNKDNKALINAELMKLNAPYDLAYKAKNGNKVLVNIFADESDKLKNIEAAMILVEKLSINVNVRAHVEVQNITNPEYFINGVVADLKNLESKNGIKNSFENAKNQFANFNFHSLVFDLSNIDISKKEIIAQLNNRVTKTRGKKIKELFFIKGNKAVSLTREEIIQQKFDVLNKVL